MPFAWLEPPMFARKHRPAQQRPPGFDQTGVVVRRWPAVATDRVKVGRPDLAA